ncbi:hypothetical protein [Bradyrhizobium sp. Rc2d]|uniref:hypothetical protein n=1 Tax=Bradyrhizobium sp. Rc2d TaxID=1855321 RepID=UPI001FCCC143|nr:hypothetical protein [Bradyrhizobium sp. Rc2d]
MPTFIGDRAARICRRHASAYAQRGCISAKRGVTYAERARICPKARRAADPPPYDLGFAA